MCIRDSDQPVTPAKPEKPDTPRTGDESLLVLWMGAAALSGAAVLLIDVYKRQLHRHRVPGG